ncbi:hypothetical protein TVAG_403760 [Trichomonas vaginalis G3]|uniref:Uncharacterized protein n=1 Tax=Trichomonas vaginalis (strain ATCC PRA-98 / G3) TaxID=412133 RepID=A2ELQ4_TRIV3|nr:hypothetical protein TVAGG3_0895030 [Trichomonas vaginalis G3]EAY06419.1 hypothetical protein TVAG_403760 [Trichomonas vaginalis G3]KAI5503007.1 hypothetical protein TVAGG3_0895030 [Trichomonas vaginalis G3]|eukprot:XP_001318642.1 hypothetical protein [Trichomonas vaginalis G3]
MNLIYLLKNDQIKLQNSILLYEKLGTIRFTVSNEENLRIECGDKSLDIVPSFYINNQVCTVFFDKSVYSVSSFATGYIRVLSDGKRFVFKSNFEGPPDIFKIPAEASNVIYEFSKAPTPKTPSPTKAPQPEPSNSSFFLGMTMKQTICLLFIIVDVVTIIALSSNLIYVYFYKFEEMVYPSRSSSLYSNEGLGLMDEL